ncbi:MAG: SUMF1/EgtB/PvdO family nonheme iron enzyme [Deltaproteobacteria bacterium]|nr:SUMF1/EgtB/PvdO family nonheme iron enzyme [Deltaproteobacteria bacterium]
MSSGRAPAGALAAADRHEAGAVEPARAALPEHELETGRAEAPATGPPPAAEARLGSLAGASHTAPGVARRSRQSRALKAGIALAAGLAASVAVLVLFRRASKGGRSRAAPAAATAQPRSASAPASSAARRRAPPQGMVAIEKGSFRVGCAAGDRECRDDERPAHDEQIGPFGIMVHEVTMAQYDQCVAERRCPAAGKGGGCTWQQEGKESHPITCVGWQAAAAYCASRSWRLPTEAEWEAAARGPSRPDYPWGEAAAGCELAELAGAQGPGCGAGGPLAVGSRPKDRSWAGVLDMGGNVREWTASTYAAYPGGKADPERSGKVNRGASWLMSPDRANTSHTRDEMRAEEAARRGAEQRRAAEQEARRRAERDAAGRAEEERRVAERRAASDRYLCEQARKADAVVAWQAYLDGFP